MSCQIQSHGVARQPIYFRDRREGVLINAMIVIISSRCREPFTSNLLRHLAIPADLNASACASVKDASGIEPSVIVLGDIGKPTLNLLQFAAEVYLPYLKANERALNDRQPSFSIELDGLRYSQAPFKYHAKWRRVLREKYEAMPSSHRADVDPILGNVNSLMSV
jgi:hypothetical protein